MKPDYVDALNDIINTGYVFKSRLGDCWELRNYQVTFLAGEMFRRPGISRQLGWVEVLQAIGGYFDRLELCAVAPKAIPSQFDVRSCFASFGDQFEGIVDQLRSNPETRRALIYLDPGGIYEGMKPCATLMQFHAREGVLHSSAYQRSWDMVHGFIYDSMVYGAVTQAVAIATGLEPGFVTATAGSAHVYRQDFDAGKTEATPKYGRYFHLVHPLGTSAAEFMQWAGETATMRVNWPEGLMGRVPPGILVTKEDSQGE